MTTNLDYRDRKEYHYFGEWTTEPPTEGGTYWAWVHVENRSGKSYPQVIDIYIHEGEIHIDWPVSGYEWDPNFEVKDITHWLGPLPVPEPPTEEK